VTTKEVDWACGTECPRDAEAISSVPGFPGHFVVLSSEGGWFHVALGKAGAETLARGTLAGVSAAPRGGAARNHEGLTIEVVGGRDAVALWAHRGRGDDPAVLAWARATITPVGAGGCRVEIGPAVGSAEVVTPEPRPLDDARRHVADLRLAPSGRLWAVSTRDPRDAGPFDSALYALGTVVVRDGKIVFDPAPPPSPHRTFPGRKVEALELAPDGAFLLGAGDDRTGGWVLRSR
jgi:hypothetical protein